MRTQLVATLVLLCLGLCAGCGEPPPLDRSLLTGEPCEPPCWQGLTPGESTLEEVDEFIRTSGFVNTRTMYRVRMTRGGEVVEVDISWDSAAGGFGPHNSFRVQGGVLKDITIRPDYALTLEQIFERYGPPEKYHAILQEVEVRFADITLFYPAHGFIVYLSRRPDCTDSGAPEITLAPESQVGSVWYFRAAPLERFLELRDEAGYGGPPPDRILESLHDWEGYGLIELD
jgi:hypothetical protein